MWECGAVVMCMAKKRCDELVLKQEQPWKQDNFWAFFTLRLLPPVPKFCPLRTVVVGSRREADIATGSRWLVTSASCPRNKSSHLFRTSGERHHDYKAVTNGNHPISSKTGGKPSLFWSPCCSLFSLSFTLSVAYSVVLDHSLHNCWMSYFKIFHP